LLCCRFYRRWHRIFLRLIYRLNRHEKHQQSNHPSNRRWHSLRWRLSSHSHHPHSQR
jgi:hypothetical protein